MLRTLSATLVVLGLLFAVPAPAQAQMQSKAYAPENLRTLSRQDQERVIGQEYSEQARGRRIPDDQLRFYIDQVNRSNWGFSRIKQDIATSLGGNGNGGWNPGPGPGNGASVQCESDNNRRRECRTGFRGRAILIQNISQTRCVEGQNWGQQRGAVWVSSGCRAEFVQGNGNGNGNGSWNPGNGDSNYSVTCSSANGRRSTCAWTSRNRPVLIQQLSSDACREGSSWGYSGNQIWVDRGCRARFGVR